MAPSRILPFEQFVVVVADVFKIADSDDLTRDSLLRDDLDLDSLDLIELAVVLDEVADFDVPGEAIASLRTLGDLYDQFVSYTSAD